MTYSPVGDIIINMICESVSTGENSPHTPDVLIVLGKNIGVGSNQEDIQADNFSLSRESRMNALAAGMLWRPGMDIIFSTGQTAPGTPSEAEAMKRYMQIHFKDEHDNPLIPEENIFLEETSIDTAGNAEEVSRLLAERGKTYNHIGLVSVGYHVPRAATLFNRYGVAIGTEYSSDQLLRSRSSRHNQLVDHWRKTPRIKNRSPLNLGETGKEFVLRALLHVDRKGKALRKVTQRSRA